MLFTAAQALRTGRARCGPLFVLSLTPSPSVRPSHDHTRNPGSWPKDVERGGAWSTPCWKLRDVFAPFQICGETVYFQGLPYDARGIYSRALIVDGVLCQCCASVVLR